jgi:CheY-like chemotaxis protein
VNLLITKTGLWGGIRRNFAVLQPREVSKGKPVLRILAVDDEPAVCTAIKMALEFDGHKVQMANSGGEALALLEQDRFDLVITDFSMPEMKGDALAAAVKQRLPNQPVLMISGNGVMAKASGDPLTGVDLVIGKPFLLEELRTAIAKVLTKT